jgi:hypothetical protein
VVAVLRFPEHSKHTLFARGCFVFVLVGACKVWLMKKEVLMATRDTTVDRCFFWKKKKLRRRSSRRIGW